MRQIAAYLCLVAGTALVADSALTQADDDTGVPAAESTDDGGSQQAEKQKQGRRERKRRGRGRGPSGQFGPPGRRGPHGPPPIIAALDADEDGVISSSEIEAAPAALKSLDENEDGQLTFDELHPGPPPGEHGRRGGRRGRGGADGERGDHGPPRGGPPSPEKFIDHVMEADEDGDGRITEDEAPERLKRRFERIDANEDGAIDRAELEEAARKMMEKRGRRGARRGHGKSRSGDGLEKADRPSEDDSEV